MKVRLAQTHPSNLWVFNGDLITGQRVFDNNASSLVDKLFEPLNNKYRKKLFPEVRFASNYGPHDSTYNVSATELVDAERRHTNSWTRHNMVPAEPGEDVGETNYFIPVFPAKCELELLPPIRKFVNEDTVYRRLRAEKPTDCAPLLILWFLDSRGGEVYKKLGRDGKPIRRPNWVHEKVVKWFLDTNAKLKSIYGREIASAVFTHIPIRAYEVARASGLVNPKFMPGSQRDHKLYTQGTHWCRNGTYAPNEPECEYGGQDEPLMKALLKTEELLGVFASHNHGTWWTYLWDSPLAGLPNLNQSHLNQTINGTHIPLMLGPKSGAGGYGKNNQGMRLVRFYINRFTGRAGLLTRAGSWCYSPEDWAVFLKGLKPKFPGMLYHNTTKLRYPHSSANWGNYNETDGWNLHGSTREEWEEEIARPLVPNASESAANATEACATATNSSAARPCKAKAT